MFHNELQSILRLICQTKVIFKIEPQINQHSLQNMALILHFSQKPFLTNQHSALLSASIIYQSYILVGKTDLQ